MNQKFIIRNNSQSLALVFAGWGSSADLLRDIQVPCDVMIVWDYTDFDFNIDDIAGYSNIYLFAWSFGIVAANNVVEKYPSLPIVLKVAINGTQEAISDTAGIPETIFKGTRDNLNERTLRKFYRRMCSSTQATETFLSTKPCFDVESLKSQLDYIESQCSKCPKTQWDKVIISQNDYIFPFENCLNAWIGCCNQMVIEETGYHLPDNLNHIISSNIIDKSLIQKRFSQSFNTSYDAEADVQTKIAQTLLSLWKENVAVEEGSSIVEVGCGSGVFTRMYVPQLHPGSLVLNDLCQEPEVIVNLNTTKYKFIQGDAENLCFEDNCADFVVSTSALQWFENLDKFFGKVHSWLKPNGYFVFSTFGRENMHEVSSLTKSGLNYKDLTTLKSLLSAGFDVILAKEEIIEKEFKTGADVLRHIKRTGVNSLSEKSGSASKARQIINNYPIRYNGDSTVYPLTYHPIYIIAKKK